ncbi:hypothetical protein [Actinomycetospora flava]|uniref:Uncharacterized protein n=1 Tax=Actinomycetospora flava TaxID=3129232 RepID=A0ABU8M8Y4_9PSEU
MTNPMRRRGTAAALGLAATVLPVLAAGTAQADETGYPSTQSPTQGVDALLGTGATTAESSADAVNGEDRAPGVDGTETEFPEADPRYVEGPLGGLLVNGPLS